MSYEVYTTKGFILGSSPAGEASKSYLLYTEDFGLIRAKAQSVRLLSSKLRYNLGDYSLVSMSLVRGKEFWRITGAERIDRDPPASPMRARVLNLLRRLVQGEEKNEKVFDVLVAFANDQEPKEHEVLAKLLSELGYLDLSKLDGKSEREAIKQINEALKETQL